jgi:hypothetical protein
MSPQQEAAKEKEKEEDQNRQMKWELTSRTQSSRVDGRTIGSIRTGGVHDSQARPEPAATGGLAMATCREVVGPGGGDLIWGRGRG